MSINPEQSQHELWRQPDNQISKVYMEELREFWQRWSYRGSLFQGVRRSVIESTWWEQGERNSPERQRGGLRNASVYFWQQKRLHMSVRNLWLFSEYYWEMGSLPLMYPIPRRMCPGRIKKWLPEGSVEALSVWPPLMEPHESTPSSKQGTVPTLQQQAPVRLGISVGGVGHRSFHYTLNDGHT